MKYFTAIIILLFGVAFSSCSQEDETTRKEIEQIAMEPRG